MKLEHIFRNPLTVEVKLPTEFYLLVGNINRNLEKILMKQAEVEAILRGAATTQEKTIREIAELQVTMTQLVQKVDELQKIIAEHGDDQVSPALRDAAERVAQLASQADDQIPDLVPIDPANVPPKPVEEKPVGEQPKEFNEIPPADSDPNTKPPTE